MKNAQDTRAVSKFVLSFLADGKSRTDSELRRALGDYPDSKRKGKWYALAFLNSWNNADRVLERLIKQGKIGRFLPAVSRERAALRISIESFVIMEVDMKRCGKGSLQISVDARTYAQFKKIVRILKREFSARIAEKIEGPDARRWRVLIAGQEIVLDQHDWGPFPMCISALGDHEDILMRIAERLKATEL